MRISNIFPREVLSVLARAPNLNRKRGVIVLNPRFASLLLAHCVIVGCGGPGTESELPFAMGRATVVDDGDPSTQHREVYTAVITTPAKGERLPRGEVVEVECLVTVPPGGAMPSSIELDLLDRKQRVVGGRELVPKADLGGGRFMLTSSLTLPDQPGVYTLRMTGIDRVVSKKRVNSDAPIPTKKPPERIEKIGNSSVTWSGGGGSSSRTIRFDPVEVRLQ